MKSYLNFLSRHKLYSAIQAFGLSVSLGFVILLTSYAHTEFTVASDQPLYHDLYVLGAGNYSGMTLATAEEFFPSVPEIKRWTRYVRFAPKNDVTVGTDYYETEIAAMDTNFLAFFNYKRDARASASWQAATTCCSPSRLPARHSGTRTRWGAPSC